MKLAEILQNVPVLSLEGNKDAEISGLSEDSRTVEKGFAFFARKGAKSSGIKFIEEAVLKGAAAIITEEEIPRLPVPVARVPSVTAVEPAAASAFYRNPSSHLALVGVTGTNGKTTFTYLMESIAKEAGWKTGVIGTVSYRLPRPDSDQTEILDAPNTTPNALELQKILHTMVERKVQLAVMEVSSHALALGRVEGLQFDGVVFTNLTQDHLDFHKSMESYFEAKSRLFQMILADKKPKSARNPAKIDCGKFAIINLDDPYGKRMASFSRVPVTTYALSQSADFAASSIELSSQGTRFEVHTPAGNFPVQLHLPGQHNVYNALTALSTAYRLGVAPKDAVRGVENLKRVPGRLEPVECRQNFSVLVDYAHTEDALRNVLESLGKLPRNRILTLFGCGGDRDRAKRPLMGKIAVELSDWVIVTSDNPRTEDPRQIILDIELGIHKTGRTNYEITIDRFEAIGKILKMAKKGDIVLLAGKGHETYQIFKDKTIHFDDREVAREFLCNL